MHQLTRICIQNWYLIDALDIDIKGATALVGPTGAGKSSVQDAIQTVITGANQNRLHLNPSASGKSSRNVLEYCLGMTKDPSEGGKPLRSSCETVLALVFRNEETDEPTTIGIAMSAREGDSREEVLSRFLIPGHAYSVKEARRRDGAQETLASWEEISGNLRRNHPGMEEYKASAEKFTADVLKHMRGSGQAPNARHFLRSFANALAFKPIFDPTMFVRDYVLEPDPLDVERVRNSIATWQELEHIIEDIEQRVRRMSKLSGRFRNWGRARMKGESARFASAAAEARRAAHDVGAYKELFSRKSAELNTERTALSSRRQWIREFDDEIRAKRVLLQAGGEAARLRHIEVESRLAKRDSDDAEGRYRDIRSALSAISSLAPVADEMPTRFGSAVEKAKDALRMMPETADPAGAIKAKGETLQEAVDIILGIDGLETILEERAEQMSDELRGMQGEADRIGQMLGQSGSGNAILSSSTTRLLGTLSRRGMNPVPLCDVVEITDESWQYALESLLGRGREAVIVEPERLDEAFELMWRERDVYSGCTLVKTSSTSRINTRVPQNSILETVSTDNEHASAFMAVRIGSFQKAEDEAELSRLDRGVMRNGKTSSGMALSVQRNLKELLIGRNAREKTSETLRNDLAPLQDKLIKTRMTVKMLKEAVRMLPQALHTLKDGPGPFQLEHDLNSVAMRIRSLADQKQASGDSGEADLLQEIEGMEEDRKLYAIEISEEIEPAVERLQGEAAAAKAKLDVAQESLRSAIKSRKKAWEALSSKEIQRIPELDPDIDEPNAAGTCRSVRLDIRRGEESRKDAKSWLASFRNDQKVIADNSDGEARREQAGAIRELAEYAANWDAEVPEMSSDNMTVGYSWVMGELSRLENNELRQHREACTKAADEMRRMLKEDLLTRLAEKLNKVHHRMDALNSYLSRHRFTGQTYSFVSAVNQRYGRMHDLAMKIGGHNENDGSLDDAEVSEAVLELEGMIEGADDAATLADYRQYFTFEIVMTDAAGGKTTMSTRAVKGSGGEAQAPFYVAIAASLASAYFPGHSGGRPTGMGLALFDEAFNKLDVPNTQALLKFFRDMGLQLMIAGPEDKRATFTEVLDTIVLVNKSLDGSSVYIDTEYPGDLARQALGEINPDHFGPEFYGTIN